MFGFNFIGWDLWQFKLELGMAQVLKGLARRGLELKTLLAGEVVCSP